MILREFVPDDLEDIIALHRDPRVTALLIDTAPNSRLIGDVYLRWAADIYARDDVGPLHAAAKSTGAFAGSFSLVRDDASGHLELGGRLYPEYWGTGLAFEGGAALVDHAFAIRKEPALCSLGHPGNRAIDFVLARLGFIPSGFRTAFGQRAIEWTQTRDAWSLRERQPLSRRDAMKIATNRRKLRDDP
ncbi:MAG: GNAT family N-acetyltransferase [Pacificimonas sp.]